MKKILGLSFAAALAVSAISAFAQSSGVQYTANGYANLQLTNQANAVSTNWGTTTASSLTVGPVRARSIVIQIEGQNDAAGTVTFTLPYQRSTDGVNYETTLQTLAVSIATTAKTTIVTNLSLYGAGYIKFPYFTNSIAAGACNGTNYFVRIPLNYNAP